MTSHETCENINNGKGVNNLAKKSINHHHSLIILLSVALVVFSLFILFIRNNSADKAFDQYGYNYKARIFNEVADGIDRNIDGTVWGDPTYANDRVVMKWSKAWDDARFNGKPWTPDAWEDNEWNGKVPGGSGEIWHYKIVWVGPELEASPYWREGGDPIWGEFEVIFSQGTVANEHFWETHASPAGYGLF